MRRPLLPVLLLLSGALLLGCADDDPAPDDSSSASSSAGPSSSPATGTAAVCSSLGDLQTSVTALGQVPLAEGGLDAVRTAFTTVQDDAAQVVDDARDEYAEQSDQLGADVSAIQDALGAAAADPGAATLQAVGGAIATLTRDVTAFAGDVGSTC